MIGLLGDPDNPPRSTAPTPRGLGAGGTDGEDAFLLGGLKEVESVKRWARFATALSSLMAIVLAGGAYWKA